VRTRRPLRGLSMKVSSRSEEGIRSHCQRTSHSPSGINLTTPEKRRLLLDPQRPDFPNSMWESGPPPPAAPTAPPPAPPAPLSPPTPVLPVPPPPVFDAPPDSSPVESTPISVDAPITHPTCTHKPWRLLCAIHSGEGVIWPPTPSALLCE
jgi:hypothetical protein